MCFRVERETDAERRHRNIRSRYGCKAADWPWFRNLKVQRVCCYFYFYCSLGVSPVPWWATSGFRMRWIQRCLCLTSAAWCLAITYSESGVILPIVFNSHLLIWCGAKAHSWCLCTCAPRSLRSFWKSLLPINKRKVLIWFPWLWPHRGVMEKWTLLFTHSGCRRERCAPPVRQVSALPEQYAGQQENAWGPEVKDGWGFGVVSGLGLFSRSQL